MAAGIRFTETMRGHLSTVAADDFAAAEARGRQDGTTCAFTVTVSAADLQAMLQAPSHDARIDGTVDCPTLSPQPLQVSGGRFQLLVADAAHVNTRRMIYTMTAVADDGATYRIDGFKSIHDDRRLEVWADTTTLFVTVTGTGGPAERPVGRGVLHILPADFLHQMTTMEVTGAASVTERLAGLAAFGRFFAGALFDTYGGVFVRSNELEPGGQPRERRALRMSAPEVHLFKTGDGVDLRLTRFKGGAKGPVMLVPGFGTSTLAFTIDTVETNLPETLFAAGYDVWLLDYRASPDLPSSHTQFTLDEVATEDYPAAVATVRAVTGAASVQVMAHCVGSMTFLMAMLSGLEGVRSAVCSALSFYPVSPMANRIRAGLDLGTLAARAGVETLTTDFDSQRAIDVMIDAVLRVIPSQEQCTRAVCRRILGIYGDVYKHAQLNEPTHEAMHEMFGIANITTFNHISRMVRAGHIVDKDGQDTYLPHLDRLAIPITFLHGAENNLFLPEGTLKTMQTLAAANDALLYQRIVFPAYAHMDCFIGRDAARDIFPAVVSELDRFN